MSRFEEYNRLLFGETLGWCSGKRVVKHLGSEEYDVLLSLLTHWKTRLRWQAADRLGKLGDRRATEPLIEMLSDSRWFLRLHAAKALGRIDGPAVFQPLIGALKDECPFVRRGVVTGLGELNKPLVERLKCPQPGDVSNWSGGFDVLSYFSERNVVSTLRSLNSRDKDVTWTLVSALQDSDCKVRSRALLALIPYSGYLVRYQTLDAIIAEAARDQANRTG